MPLTKGAFRRSAVTAAFLLLSSGLTIGPATTASAVTADSSGNQITVSVPASTVQATVGTAVSIPITATDSAPDSTLTYSVYYNSLPPGLSLDPATGVISGAPTTVGPYTVTIGATDSTGASGSGSFIIQVGGVITLSGLSAQKSVAGQTVAFSFRGSDTGGGTPYYALSSQPPGLALNDDYSPLITGWPTTPGTYDTGVTANDGEGGYTTTSFAWTVTAAPDSGPTGAVHLNLGGKCLDDSGDKSTNGNKVDIWACNGTAAQKWTYAEDGTLRLNGKCLNVAGASTTAGTKVNLSGCTGQTNQQWVPGTDAQLVSLATGLCLDDTGQSTRNGTQADIWKCGPAGWREWTLPAGAVQSAIAGRCLDDYQASAANGARVDAYSCNGGAAQKWAFNPDGTIRVNGKCLDEAGNGTAGTKIDLWSCWGGAPQKWTVATAPGSLGIQVKHGSLCVAPTAMTAANGAQLALEACGTNQSYWKAW